jgi:hypothetical protein
MVGSLSRWPQANEARLRNDLGNVAGCSVFHEKLYEKQLIDGKESTKNVGIQCCIAAFFSCQRLCV